jgi:hypothetical protein
MIRKIHMSEIKVGDVVRVVRKVKSQAADGMGEGKEWGDYWVSTMDDWVGLECIVQRVNAFDGYTLFTEVREHSFYFPLAAIELVSGPEVRNVPE